jgi:hypothetical protein
MSTITPNPNPRPNDVVWAQNKSANIREPIAALKDKGWQFADVPTASNFNWLFNELAKWDRYLERHIDATSEDLHSIIVELKNDLKETRRDLKLTISVLSALLHKVVQHHPQPALLVPKLPDIDG